MALRDIPLPKLISSEVCIMDTALVAEALA